MAAREAAATKALERALVALDALGRERRRLEAEACVGCSLLRKLSPDDPDFPRDIPFRTCNGCEVPVCSECFDGADLCGSCAVSRLPEPFPQPAPWGGAGLRAYARSVGLQQ